MERRITWVHGIGRHTRGYSDPWRVEFNRYLRLQEEAYLEALWDVVFHPEDEGTRGATVAREAILALTPQEALAEQQVETELLTILGARKSGLEEGAATVDRGQPAARGGEPVAAPVEWSMLYRDPSAPEESADRGALAGLTWLVNPDEYLGDFAKYLVSRSIRTAVKEELKKLLRPLAGEDTAISLIAHSWGTVVAYDSLLDLSAEVPALRVANLFTLGSPLWLVRRFLEDGSGRKPSNVANFVNVHARGDFVGSWLKPAFQVDKDYEVSSIGSDAHGSYFVPGNQAVQERIVAAEISGGV